MPDNPDVYWLGKLEESGVLDTLLAEYERETRWEWLKALFRKKLRRKIKNPA